MVALGLMQTSHQDVTSFFEIAKGVLMEVSAGDGGPYYGGLGVKVSGWGVGEDDVWLMWGSFVGMVRV